MVSEPRVGPASRPPARRRTRPALVHVLRVDPRHLPEPARRRAYVAATFLRVRVVVLGAGFGGLELTTKLSETHGDDVDVVLIDKTDGFVFGFSKLDVMFGRALPEAVH